MFAKIATATAVLSAAMAFCAPLAAQAAPVAAGASVSEPDGFRFPRLAPRKPPQLKAPVLKPRGKVKVRPKGAPAGANAFFEGVIGPNGGLLLTDDRFYGCSDWQLGYWGGYWSRCMWSAPAAACGGTHVFVNVAYYWDAGNGRSVPWLQSVSDCVGTPGPWTYL